MGDLLQVCPGNSHLLKPCGGLINPCNYPTCWSVGTAGFHRNPKGISFDCHGCAQPGVLFTRFATSAPDGSDLDVMCPVKASVNTICLETFAIPLHLASSGWHIAYTDSDKVVWACIRSSRTAGIFKEPEHCPDFCTQMSLPATIPDPGGARNGGGSSTPPPCGSWCITTAGSSNTYNPIVPGAAGDPQVSDGICYDNALCHPGPI